MKALPVKVALRRRGFYLDEGCCVCWRETESNTHVLRDCEMANEVWRLLPCGKVILGPCPSDPMEWIKYIDG